MQIQRGTNNVPDPHAVQAIGKDIDQLARSATEGPVVQLVQEIMLAALDRRASDIHIEADAVGGVVRLRVSGELIQDRRLQEAEVRAVQSRIKIMAGLNISELRRPQDGRIRQTLRGINVDLRVASLPTQFGESIVIRVLDHRGRPESLDALGFTANRAQELRQVFARSEGLFLITGPTGSGKTTTLYTGLSELDTAEKKIIAIEDPIEYTLPSICQTQVHPEVGFDFADALRAVLRQDIDLVLVGEIRDTNTAQQAVRIAMTGRLVLSTLHTVNAVGAIDRLRDLEIPDFLIASTLIGAMSQRLVRRKDGNGRVVISELLRIDATLSEAIGAGQGGQDILAAARKTGFSTLEEDGLRMVDDGLISAQTLHKTISPSGI